ETNHVTIGLRRRATTVSRHANGRRGPDTATAIRLKTLTTLKSRYRRPCPACRLTCVPVPSRPECRQPVPRPCSQRPAAPTYGRILHACSLSSYLHEQGVRPRIAGSFID